jgi:hypothetical protein
MPFSVAAQLLIGLQQNVRLSFEREAADRYATFSLGGHAKIALALPVPLAAFAVVCF